MGKRFDSQPAVLGRKVGEIAVRYTSQKGVFEEGEKGVGQTSRRPSA